MSGIALHMQTVFLAGAVIYPVESRVTSRVAQLPFFTGEYKQRYFWSSTTMRFEPIQNEWALIALQRIKCNLNRNTVQCLSESHTISHTAPV